MKFATSHWKVLDRFMCSHWWQLGLKWSAPKKLVESNPFLNQPPPPSSSPGWSRRRCRIAWRKAAKPGNMPSHFRTLSTQGIWHRWPFHQRWKQRTRSWLIWFPERSRIQHNTWSIWRSLKKSWLGTRRLRWINPGGVTWVGHIRS